MKRIPKQVEETDDVAVVRERAGRDDWVELCFERGNGFEPCVYSQANRIDDQGIQVSGHGVTYAHWTIRWEQLVSARVVDRRQEPKLVPVIHPYERAIGKRSHLHYVRKKPTA